ncbi:MAG: type II toxin-antitoxin system RelE/ParE family toxin [Clostridiales bacterium]|nr:type II toxin-antitoxin system RelE/ParE family toxin [Clostridiales bacterium]
MYRVILLPRAEKQLRKIKERELLGAFRQCLRDISVQPFRKSKVGALKNVFGHGFNYRGTAYRVAYLMDTEEHVIYIIGLGSHEGFWDDIKRWYLKC